MDNDLFQIMLLTILIPIGIILVFFDVKFDILTFHLSLKKKIRQPYTRTKFSEYIIPLNQNQYQREFKEILIKVAAKAMLSDEKATKIELENIKNYFIKYFGKNGYEESFLQLQKELKLNRDIKEIYKTINERFDYFSKIQMLHLVVGVLTADGKILDNEDKFLLNFIEQTKIDFKTFQSILAMYSFTRKKSTKQQEKKDSKTSQPTKKNITPYIILEITPNSSDSEIKKAYRKLVLLHHPDKLNYLGDEFVQQANEKFKKIQEAYEIIKKERGIK